MFKRLAKQNAFLWKIFLAQLLNMCILKTIKGKQPAKLIHKNNTMNDTKNTTKSHPNDALINKDLLDFVNSL